jgi:hypothetical protein
VNAAGDALIADARSRRRVKRLMRRVRNPLEITGNAIANFVSTHRRGRKSSQRLVKNSYAICG